MCQKCSAAYDQVDDSTIYSALVWAAKRARWYEQRRKWQRPIEEES
jgi:hypothetical protein